MAQSTTWLLTDVNMFFLCGPIMPSTDGSTFGSQASSE